MEERVARERQMAEQRAAEDEKRRDVILQIRALERAFISEASADKTGISKAKEKVFDPTTTPGYGLLDEMSLFELEEKLKQLKVREEKLREEKRRQILQAKIDKDDELQQRMEFISRFRTNAEQDAQERFACLHFITSILLIHPSSFFSFSLSLFFSSLQERKSTQRCTGEGEEASS